MFSYEPIDETPVCECKPCEECGGEGGRWVRYTLNQRNHWEELVEPQWFTCRPCQGTGIDSSGCEIEHRKEVVAR